jgi:hypothetical protein
LPKATVNYLKPIAAISQADKNITRNIEKYSDIVHDGRMDGCGFHRTMKVVPPSEGIQVVPYLTLYPVWGETNTSDSASAKSKRHIFRTLCHSENAQIKSIEVVLSVLSVFR